MKSLIILGALVLTQFAFATTPPDGYPVVKGIVRRVDLSAGRISIKHEAIPNLNMPPMTMSFLVQDPQLLDGLSVDDKINFVADEIDGELTVLWLEKENQASLPIVKGLVRRIDLASNRISIKHEAIPNLNMPPMTMSFLVLDPKFLDGLAAGDNINFTADEVDGELSVIWLKKRAQPVIGTSNILCSGVAPTTPKTNVEIEIRSNRFSTIRYEYAEGPYKGTSHINSIGNLHLHKQGEVFVYTSGSGELASTLVFKLNGFEIVDSLFSNYSSGMERSPVKCAFSE
jgi:Cu(I)/Ag(I) efflux system periplasmic protein CusF